MKKILLAIVLTFSISNSSLTGNAFAMGQARPNPAPVSTPTPPLFQYNNCVVLAPSQSDATGASCSGFGGAYLGSNGNSYLLSQSVDMCANHWDNGDRFPCPAGEGDGHGDAIEFMYRQNDSCLDTLSDAIAYIESNPACQSALNAPTTPATNANTICGATASTSGGVLDSVTGNCTYSTPKILYNGAMIPLSQDTNGIPNNDTAAGFCALAGKEFGSVQLGGCDGSNVCSLEAVELSPTGQIRSILGAGSNTNGVFLTVICH